MTGAAPATVAGAALTSTACDPARNDEPFQAGCR